MMIRHLAATGTFLSLALLPLSAQAYVTPEEGLNDETLTTRFYEPPPSKRELEAIQQQQQLTSAERRAAELKAVMPQPEPEPEEMHDAAPEEPQSDLDKMIQLIQLLQSNQASSQPTQTDARAALDPASQRLLIRAEAQAAAAERAALIQSLIGNEEGTLHSGAPLTDSGPASTLTFLAIAGAIAETWRRVRKAQKLVQS